MGRVSLAVLVVVLTAPAGSTLVGCGGTGCLGNAVQGLRVTVLEGPGGAAVCGATVTATDGAYSETLVAGPSGGPCDYHGAIERTGVYARGDIRGPDGDDIERDRGQGCVPRDHAGHPDGPARRIGDEAQVSARWKALRQGVLSNAALDQRITDIAAPLATAAARDIQCWPVSTVFSGTQSYSGPTATTWEGQVQAIPVSAPQAPHLDGR